MTKTPGQVAYEAYTQSSSYTRRSWIALLDRTQAHWETVAQAVLAHAPLEGLAVAPTATDLANAHPEDRLIEECSELIHALCKAKRFGWFNFHPNTPNQVNIDTVLSEMADVSWTIKSMEIQMRMLKIVHKRQAFAEGVK